MAYPKRTNRVTQPRKRATLGGGDASDTLGSSGDEIGIIPAIVTAAIPSVRTLALKALNSVVGIFDPGKRRDTNRASRAVMWGDIAVAGSITAARRVLGGTTLQFTDKERQYYRDQWKRLQSAEPRLAAQAQTLGGIGIPEPGSDQEPAKIGDEDLSSLQREIDAYRAGVNSAPSSTGAPASAPAKAGAGTLLGLGLLGALLSKLFKGR